MTSGEERNKEMVSNSRGLYKLKTPKRAYYSWIDLVEEEIVGGVGYLKFEVLLTHRTKASKGTFNNFRERSKDYLLPMAFFE